MNTHQERRAAAWLLAAFVVLCVSQVATAGLVAAGLVWSAGWLWPTALATAIGAIVVTGMVIVAARRWWLPRQALLVEVDELTRQRLPDILNAAVESKTTDPVSLRLPRPSDNRLAALISGIETICTDAARLASKHDDIRAGYSEVFVTLFRRTQSLLLRQLQVIEQLEQGDRSAGDLNLIFQLDHLVARMRRNNENILVLSGTELVRKTKDPVAVADLLRVAISEIGSYQRVRVVAAPTRVRVSNAAAGDLIRIVAELLDNATSFSAPDQQVSVKAEIGRHHGLTIGVVDNGIGMSDEGIRKANEQLGRLGSAEIARSRRVGLLVVGRLAGKHGYRVELFGGDEVDGVSALISVPSSALLEEAAVRPTLPGELRRESAIPGRAASGSAVQVTTSVRRADAGTTEAAATRTRRKSSWYTRSNATARPRRGGAELVALAHADVPGELPTRVPNEPAEKVQSPRPRPTASRWFQARSAARQQLEVGSRDRRESAEDAPENWQSRMDRGWEKAEDVTRSDGSNLTEDGLPLRRKGAHLSPGLAGGPSADDAPRVAKPIERDATTTRSRLSSYQQGVRKAKEQEDKARGVPQVGGWTVLESTNTGKVKK